MVGDIRYGVNTYCIYKKANKNKKEFFKRLSDLHKNHSDAKWIMVLNYELQDYVEDVNKYKTIHDKENILFKLRQNNVEIDGNLKRKGKIKKDNNIYLNKKLFSGKAFVMNGYNGYTETEDDGYLIASKTRIPLTRKNGEIIIRTDWREQEFTIINGVITERIGE